MPRSLICRCYSFQLIIRLHRRPDRASPFFPHRYIAYSNPRWTLAFCICICIASIVPSQTHTVHPLDPICNLTFYSYFYICISSWLSRDTIFLQLPSATYHPTCLRPFFISEDDILPAFQKTYKISRYRHHALLFIPCSRATPCWTDDYDLCRPHPSRAPQSYQGSRCRRQS